MHIRFAGVKSAFFLYINGQEAGYSQGSMLPAEFDISALLQPGLNQVTCQVLRWSDGSLLEDQDTPAQTRLLLPVVGHPGLCGQETWRIDRGSGGRTYACRMRGVKQRRCRCVIL